MTKTVDKYCNNCNHLYTDFRKNPCKDCLKAQAEHVDCPDFIPPAWERRDKESPK